MDAPCYALIVYLRAARNISPPRHSCEWYRTMRWRTAPRYGEAVRPRILPLRRLPEVRGPHRNVVEKGDVTGFDADQCAVAAAAPASGYEVEFLIRKLDGVR